MAFLGSIKYLFYNELDNVLIHQSHVISIGGLVVKLAVAIDIYDVYDSASPGFDSRPMHFALRSYHDFLWRLFLLEPATRTCNDICI